MGGAGGLKNEMLQPWRIGLKGRTLVKSVIIIRYDDSNISNNNDIGNKYKNNSNNNSSNYNSDNNKSNNESNNKNTTYTYDKLSCLTLRIR